MPDHPKGRVIRVNPKIGPDDPAIAEAGQVLSRDGVVIFPASCLYGVAAHALSDRAVEKVFSLKQRPKDNPILVLVQDLSMLKELVTAIPEPARILMDRFWPGRLTLVFEAAPRVSPHLTAGTGKIGIRMPGHPVAQALVRAVPFPITGTSANLSGQPGATNAQDLPRAILNQVDLVLDAGPLSGGRGSTICDITAFPPRVLREGALPAAEIFEALAAQGLSHKIV